VLKYVDKNMSADPSSIIDVEDYRHMFRNLHLAKLVGIEPQINLGYVPEFIASLRRAKTGDELVTAVSEIVRDIGFDTFVYGALIPNDQNDPDVAVVTSMPSEWVERYDRMSYIEVDPRVQTCLSHVTPFLWESRRSYGPRADAFLKDGAKYGLRSGIAFLLRSAAGENAMFGVNSSRDALLDNGKLQLAVGKAHLFASFFHEWFFHNLRNPRVKFDMALPEVSKRELEVLSLASRGRSSKQIARELGISESTANFHIASVKRKFGVRTRGQAIARAVQAGLIR